MLFGKRSRFVTAIDLIRCLTQIKLQRLLLTCAPSSALPSCMNTVADNTHFLLSKLLGIRISIFRNVPEAMYKQLGNKSRSQKVSRFIVIYFWTGLISKVSYVNLNHMGGGQVEPCDAERSEKCLYVHHNNTSLIRQITKKSIWKYLFNNK